MTARQCDRGCSRSTSIFWAVQIRSAVASAVLHSVQWDFVAWINGIRILCINSNFELRSEPPARFKFTLMLKNKVRLCRGCGFELLLLELKRISTLPSSRISSYRLALHECIVAQLRIDSQSSQKCLAAFIIFFFFIVYIEI